MHAVGTSLRIEEVAVPMLAPDEVLVETRTSGICGTDLHILDGHGYVPTLPHILGHEPSGVVSDVGNQVTDWHPGDRVVPHLFFSCGHCYFCLTGSHQQCLNLKGILGVLCHGAFAEYFKVPSANLFRLPDSVDFDVGGLVADAVLTAVHAVKRSGLRLGDGAVVYGAGGVGQIIIQLLASTGSAVMAVDQSTPKLDLATQMGASSVANVRDEHYLEHVQALSSKTRCAFNCVGSGQSMRDCARMIMKGGRIVVIGEEPDFPHLDTIEIAQRELEIVGSRNGTRQEMVEALELLERGRIRPCVVARFPLHEINSAFSLMRRGVLGRIVIVVKE